MPVIPRPSTGLHRSAQQAALRECHRRYVETRGLRHGVDYHESYGDPPTICFVPSEDGGRHGNFVEESYRAIIANPEWRKRLEKVHAQAKRALPRGDRKWCELDSSNSSDALLMNVFCHPGTLAETGVLHMLGIDGPVSPQFGFRARVPLGPHTSKGAKGGAATVNPGATAAGNFDRTEVDMKLGNLLVESKLTESDFQSKTKSVLESYRDFAKVFEKRSLPHAGDRYLSYQLIRNVLAAQAHECSFCVMADARRPDLLEAWYAVMRCVKIGDLRRRCKVLTWQELALVLPSELQDFLVAKYGIGPGKGAGESA